MHKKILKKIENHKNKIKYLSFNKRFYFIAILFVLIFIHSLYINQRTTKINIYFSADMYSNFYEVNDQNKRAYGLLTFANYLDKIKNKNEKFLLFDIGNSLYRTPETDGDNAVSFVEFMSKMKYDAMCVGDYELSWDKSTLSYLANVANFTFLSCNVVPSSEHQKSVFMPYIIREIGNIKIGIIGLTNRSAFKNNLPKNIIGYSMKPVFQTLRQQVELLREDEGVDIVILLSRYGIFSKNTELDKNVSYVDNVIIADEVPGIDVILGKGLDEESILDAYISPNNKTIICNTRAKLQSIGKFELIIRNKTKKIVSFSNTQIDTSIALSSLQLGKFSHLKDLSQFQNEKDDKYNTVFGRTEFDLRHSDFASSSMSRLAADIMRDTLEADFAIIESFDIKDKINVGKIKFRDIFQVFPENQRLVKMLLTGKDILSIMEFSINNMIHNYITISGIEYIYDLKLPAYSRITEIATYEDFIKDWDLDAKYKVVVLERMLNTYIEQDIYRRAENIEITDYKIRDVFMDYISLHVPLDEKYSASNFRQNKKSMNILYKKY